MKVLLVDIDHTLSSAAWRDDMRDVAYRNEEWDKYHTESIHDKPVPEMVDLVNSLQISGWYVIGLTTRPEKFRMITNDWLLKYSCRIDQLLMRAADDFRSSKESKLNTFKNYAAVNGDIESIILIDDQDGTVEAFKKENITVLQAHVRRC